MRIHALVLFVLAQSVNLASLFAEEPRKILPGYVVGTVDGNTITAADIGLTAPIDTSLEFDARDTELWALRGRITKAFGKPLSDRFVKERKIDATEQEIATYKKTAEKRRSKHLSETEAQFDRVKSELASPNLSREVKAKLEKDKAMLDRLLPSLRKASDAEVPDEIARIQIVARKTEQALHKTYGGRVIFQQAGPEALHARRLLFEEAEKKGDLMFEDAGVRHLFFYYYSNMNHVVVDAKVLEKSPQARTARPASVPSQPTALLKEIHTTPQVAKTWIISETSAKPTELTPKRLVPVESGVWFGGRLPGSRSDPIGFLDLNTGSVTVLIENGGAHWDAVGREAIAVQLDRKSLVRLNAVDQSVETWDKPPKDCQYFSQVAAYKQHFCISSPYNPVWVFDPWLNTWQKIELELVTDLDSERLGPGYYRPSMIRFVIGPTGNLWGFQGTHDARRGNAVCRYVPEQAEWEHFGFPWATARGDDHWPIGETDNVVMFAGRTDLLFFDKQSHRWSTTQTVWPKGSYASAKFTPYGVLIPVGDTVKRLTPDLSEWESVANLGTGERITAIAAFRGSLFLATASGIYVLEETDANFFREPKLYEWKLADQAKTYNAVFGLVSQDLVLTLADKLCNASIEGDLESVRTLLSQGADTEATTDSAGSTPLLLACSKGHFHVAKLLIENGADIHARNNFRKNALTLAALHGHRQIADYLLSKGVKR